MKLLELNPQWAMAPDGAGRVGIYFDCPGHQEHRLVVFFANPFDGCLPYSGAERHWRVMAGSTFETLTISPSIHVYDEHPVTRERTFTWWHGRIVNGEILPP